MNEQTAKLIEQLAAKLGTTSEYLWGVLINQAAVSATISLFYVLLTVALGVILLRLHKKFSTQKPAKDRSYEYTISAYEKSDGIIGVPMVIGLIIWVIFLMVSLLSIPDIFNGYFNPEFWALDYIMNKLN